MNLFSRRSLLASVAVISLLTPAMTVFPAPQAAWAQKGERLEPKSGWAVTYVKGQNGSDNYCAMARRYDQGMILTLARNSKDESSFAFDFSRGDFDSSRYYTVGIDVGGGETRSYEVKPASRRAFVLRVGQDEAFFSALERTGYMRLEIGEQAYMLDLADIDQGHSQLASCIASNAMPVVGGDIDDDGQANGESDDRSSEIAALQKEIEALRAAEAKMTAAIARERENSSASSKAAKNAAALVDQIEALEQENKKIRSELAQSREKHANIPAKSKDDGTLAGLQKENETLLSRLASLESQQKALDVSRRELEKLKAENAALADIIATKDKQAASGKAQDKVVKRLEEENAKLAAELEKQQVASADNASLKEALRRLEQENAELLVAQEKDRKDALKEQRDRILELEEKNGMLSKVLAEQKGKLESYAALERSLDEMKRQNDELQRNLGQASQRAEENAATELERFRDENAALRRDLESQKASAERSAAQLRSEIEGLRAEKDAMKQAANGQQAKAEEQLLSRAEAQRQEISALENKIAALEGEIQKRDNDLLKASKQALEMQALKDAHKSIAEKLQQAERIGSAVDELELRLARVSEENTQLKTQLETAFADGQGTDGRIKALAAENERLNKVIEQMAANFETSAGSASDAEMLRKQNADLRAQLEKAQAGESVKISDLVAKVASLTDENVRLKSRIEGMGAADAVQGDLSQEIASLRSENENLRKELARNEAATADQRIVILEQENEKLRRELADVSGANAADAGHAEKLAELEKKGRDLQRQLDVASGEVARLKDILREKDMRIAELEKENADLKGRLGKAGAAQVSARAEAPVVAASAKAVPDMANEAIQHRPAGVVKTSGPSADAGRGKPAARVKDKPDVVAGDVEKDAAHKKPSVTASAAKAAAEDGKDVREEIIWTSPRAVELAAMPQGTDGERDAYIASLREQEARLRKQMASGLTAQGTAQGGQMEMQQVAKTYMRVRTLIAQAERSATQASSAVAPVKEIKAEEAPAVVIPTKAGQLNQAAAIEANPDTVQDSGQNSRPEKKITVINADPVAATPAAPVASAHDAAAGSNSAMTDAQQQEEALKALKGSAAKRAKKPAIDHSAEKPAMKPAMKAPDKQEDAKAQEPVAKPKSVTASKGEGIENLIKRSGIPVQGGVTKVSQGDGFDVYQWTVSDVFGTAESRPMDSIQLFDQYALSYLKTAQGRCHGEFAVKPSVTVEYKDRRIDGYEIACVGKDIASSAALLFFNGPGNFTVIAHETSPKSFSTAIDLSRKIQAALKGSAG